MIALRTLRARWVGFVGTFVALALGVALVSVSALLVFATTGRPTASPQLYAGTDVVVEAPRQLRITVGSGDEAYTESAVVPDQPPVPTSLIRAVAAVPGIAAAVPVRSGYAQVVVDGAPVDDARSPEARNWSAARLTPYRLVSGTEPTTSGEVVLDRRLAAAARTGLGTRVTVLLPDGSRSVRVVGIAAANGAPTVAPVFFSDRAMQQLFGTRATGAIGVLADPGTDVGALADRLAALPGGPTVYAGADRSSFDDDPDAALLEGANALLGTAAGLAAFVSIFVVSGTFAFAVLQRRREFALLRSVGATPGQIRRMVFAEAAVVAVVAAAAGCALGVAGRNLAARWMAARGLVPAGFTVEVRFLPLLIAFSIGLTVALLGVFAASRRAGRVRPVEALQSAAVEQRPMTVGRWIWAVLFVAGTTAVTIFAPRASADAALSLTVLNMELAVVSAALLAPVLVPPVVRVLTWPLTLGTGAIAMLARQNALTAVRRTASTAAPVLVTVALVVGLVAMTGTLKGALADDDARRVTAERVVVPAGTPGLTPAAVRELAATPGATVSATVPGTVVRRDGDILTDDAIVGVDPLTIGQVLDLPVRSGSLDDLTGNTMAVDDSTGYRLGQDAAVWLADGTLVDLRVVAVVDTPPSLATMLLPTDLVVAHTRQPFADVAYVRGAEPTTLPAGASVSSVSDWQATIRAAQDELNEVALLLLLGMAVLYTGIAIANTLVMAVGERSRDLAVLRLGGATPRQVIAMVGLEAVLVVTIGALLAAGVAGATLTGVVLSLRELVSVPVRVDVPWLLGLGVVCICLVLAVLASVLPAAAVLRTRALDLAGARE